MGRGQHALPCGDVVRIKCYNVCETLSTESGTKRAHYVAAPWQKQNMALWLLIAIYICPVPCKLQSALTSDTETLSPHPPILRWAQQTLVTPFYRKRERLRRVHWLQIKWQKSVSGFRPGCDTMKMNNYTRALGRLSM